MIFITMPHRDNVCGETLAGICDMIVSDIVFKRKEGYILAPFECSVLSKGRNHVWNMALKEEADWFVTIDSDTIFETETLTRLLALDKDIMSGIIPMRKPPYLPMIFKFDENGSPQNIFEWDSKPFSCDSAGGGFLVVSRKAMQELPKNPFDIVTDKKGEQLGEDTSFGFRAYQVGIPVWIDPTIKFGHKGTFIATLNHYKSFRSFNNG